MSIGERTPMSRCVPRRRVDRRNTAEPIAQPIKIYYIGGLARQCMEVCVCVVLTLCARANQHGGPRVQIYKAFVNFMNARIRRLSATANPFDFEFIESTHLDGFDDTGAAVVLASPGFMQVRRHATPAAASDGLYVRACCGGVVWTIAAAL